MDLSFDKNTNIECSFSTPDEDPPEEGWGLLVVTFCGTADNVREHAGGFDFMAAMIGAGRTLWDPGALVLDLSGLEYRWGDGMAHPIGVARGKTLANEWQEEEIPLAIVVSDKCREGLASLLDDELGLNHEDYFVDNLVSAIALAARKSKNA